MRLSLLARKLSVKPSVIIEELLIEGEKPLHGNSKLSEDQIEEIVKIFGPLPEEIEVPEPIAQESSEQSHDTLKAENVNEDVETETTSIAIEESEGVFGDESEASQQSESPKEEGSISEIEPSEEDITFMDETTGAPLPEEDRTDVLSEMEVQEEPEEEIQSEVETIETTEKTEEPIEASTNGHTPGLDEATDEKSEKREVLVADLLEDPDEELIENSDVLIKAPKVFLPGLTVKGKIELPEPKPKPEKEAPKEEDSEDSRGRRGRYRGKRRKQTNPVAAARMREERQAERRKKAQQAEEKERKRQHYQQNIKSKAAPPPKKKTNKKPAAPEPGPTNLAPEKNLNALQRFWKWMNT